jgi:hypothetical protein
VQKYKKFKTNLLGSFLPSFSTIQKMGIMAPAMVPSVMSSPSMSTMSGTITSHVPADNVNNVWFRHGVNIWFSHVAFNVVNVWFTQTAINDGLQHEIEGNWVACWRTAYPWW